MTIQTRIQKNFEKTFYVHLSRQKGIIHAGVHTPIADSVIS